MSSEGYVSFAIISLLASRLIADFWKTSNSIFFTELAVNNNTVIILCFFTDCFQTVLFFLFTLFIFSEPVFCSKFLLDCFVIKETHCKNDK